MRRLIVVTSLVLAMLAGGYAPTARAGVPPTNRSTLNGETFNGVSESNINTVDCLGVGGFGYEATGPPLARSRGGSPRPGP